MNHRLSVRLGGIGLVLLVLAGCKTRGLWKTSTDVQKRWNFEAVDSLAFPLQEKEREFSALATDAEALYLISERAGKVLRIVYPIDSGSEYEEKTLWRRKGAEYEGASTKEGRLYLIDEHSDEGANTFPLLVTLMLQRPEERISTYPLRWKGLDCNKGRCLEGLAVVGETVYLLDELDHLAGERCTSRLYVTTISALKAGSSTPPKTIDLALPDCDWRYTDLHPAPIGQRTQLLALRTRCLWNKEMKACDDDEYVVELLDPAGSPVVVSSYRFPDATVRWWRMANVSRNLEGIALGPDGTLYIVSDNRWAHGREPKSLLLRIPPR